MRVGVLGAGSIGCYVGGRLVAAGTDVTFVGRQRVVDELAEHGMTLSDRRGTVTVAATDLQVTTDDDVLAAADVVAVCVKSAQTPQAAEILSRVLAPGAVVLSLQNGVRNVPVLRSALPGHTVLGAVVDFNVVARGDGAFHCGLDGALTIEEPVDRALVDALRHAGLTVRTTGAIAPAQWAKLLVNLNNAISALSDAPTRDLMARPGYRQVVAALLAEGIAVLRVAGIRPGRVRGVAPGLMLRVLRLPDPLARRLLAARLPADAQARSSMWEDLTRGRPTEVDHLNGEIVALARRSGVDAPVNRRIVELVHDAERAGRGSPALSPAELRAALRGR